jgi:8-oxo-dGTP pyrophosphatase MutT (NUDIX family)
LSARGDSIDAKRIAQAPITLYVAVCYKHPVRREFSAGGVVVRRLRGRWFLAAIRPGGKPAGTWALPKGLIGRRENAEETALREVEEETGVRGRPLGKLGDVRYVYTWAGERIFKVVSFYLVRYAAGRLGDLSPELAHEVEEARWLPLEEAPRLLAYKGEREMAEQALAELGRRFPKAKRRARQSGARSSSIDA